MFFSDKITLRAVTVTLDNYGDAVKTYTDTVVFADKKSVARAEFYAANSSGIKIDAVFDVHSEDYADQHVILYSTTQYEVIRSYQKGEGTVELMCAVREVV